MRQSPSHSHPIFLRCLLIFMLASFCLPFTLFEEANAYITDTASELTHYYLTPLPDNGEACVEAPRIVCLAVKTPLLPQDLKKPFDPPPAIFFHPPK